MTAKSTGSGFDPSSNESRTRNIYLNLYFHFFALVSRQSAALSSLAKMRRIPFSGAKEFAWNALISGTTGPS